MITQCPHCRTKFKARSELKGKRTKCPRCKEPFNIVEFATDLASATERKDVAMDQRECWLCHAKKSQSEGRTLTLKEFNKKIAPRLATERPKNDSEALLRAALLGFSQSTEIFNPRGAKRVPMYWICKDCQDKYSA